MEDEKEKKEEEPQKVTHFIQPDDSYMEVKLELDIGQPKE